MPCVLVNRYHCYSSILIVSKQFNDLYGHQAGDQALISYIRKCMNTKDAVFKIKTPWHYDRVSRLLHWLLAIILMGLLALGWYMTSIEDQPDSGKFFNLHKSIGLIAASLILIRLVWRGFHKPASLPATMARWQVKLAQLSHFLLYVCIIIMPMTGFIGASYSKHGVSFFGLTLPTWVSQNKEIAKNLLSAHGLIAWVLAILIAVHVLAAVKHLIIDRDKVFQRMWFWKV